MTVRDSEHGPHGAYSPASPPPAPLVIRDADLGGPGPVDVVVEAGRIRAVGAGAGRGRPGEPVDARGGALLPGLHDHHVHLRSLAAAAGSVAAGPPEVTDRAGLVAALRKGREQARATGRGWVRAVGYHESVAGPLDRRDIDAAVPDMPVRVQDRSGAVWIVNSPGAAVLGLDGVDEPGVDRDAGGVVTGRLFRMDDWLRSRTAGDGGAEETLAAGLAEVGRAAAANGVTGFTDATPGLTPGDLAFWRRLAGAGVLDQRLTVMWSLDPRLGAGAGNDSAGGPAPGPVKFLLDDADLPVPDVLAGELSAAHRAGRAVALHCVTRAQAVVAVAALERAGPHPGDRIEHGSLIPAELIPALRRAGTTVVTNPSLVRERGDRYLADVDADDRPDLYRLASLARGGVAVAGGTDAPFGNPDPWVSIRAAVERRTRGGLPLGPGEAVPVARAVGLFTGPAGAPGRPGRVVAGAAADLCLLDRPWAALLGTPAPELSAELVRATVVGGRIVHRHA